MSAFNAEVVSKVQDKRIAVLEKLVQTLQVDARQNDVAVVMKKELAALETKVGNLEKMVKVLVETRDSSKLEAMEKILKVTAETSVKKADLDKLIATHAGREFANMMGKQQVGDPKARQAIREAMDEERKQNAKERQAMEQEIAKLRDAQRTFDKEMKAESERKEREAEKARQDQKAEVERLKQEQDKKIKAQVDQMKLDARFQQLDTQIKALSQQLNAVTAMKR